MYLGLTDQIKKIQKEEKKNSKIFFGNFTSFPRSFYVIFINIG